MSLRAALGGVAIRSKLNRRFPRSLRSLGMTKNGQEIPTAAMPPRNDNNGALDENGISHHRIHGTERTKRP